MSQPLATPTERGTIVSVDVVPLGSALSQDTATGAMTLVVDDTADFEEGGGTLGINGQTIAYSGFDDDTSTITLSAALAADGAQGDTVAVWDTTADQQAATQVAEVMLDGTDDDGSSDPIAVDMADWLIDRVDPGIRAEAGEIVLISQDETGDWRIVDVIGKSSVPTVAASTAVTVSQVQTDITDLNSQASTIQGIVTALSSIWYGSTFPTVGTHPTGAEQGDLYVQPYFDTHGQNAKRLFICQPGTPASGPGAAGWIFLQLGLDGLVANFIEGQTLTGVTVQTSLNSTGYTELISSFAEFYSIGGAQVGSVGYGGDIELNSYGEDISITANGGEIQGQATSIHLRGIGSGQTSGVYLDGLLGASSLATGGGGQIIAVSTSTRQWKAFTSSLTDDEITAVLSLETVVGKWRGNPDQEDGTPFVGVIAEDAELALRAAPRLSKILIDRDSYGQVRGFNYPYFSMILHAIVQRHEARISALEAKESA